MFILGIIANASFVQCKGRRPERVDKLLISRYVWAAGLGDPSFDTMKKRKAVIDNGDPLDMNGILSALQDAMPQLIEYWRRDKTGRNHPQTSGTGRPKTLCMASDQDPEKVLQERRHSYCQSFCFPWSFAASRLVSVSRTAMFSPSRRDDAVLRPLPSIRIMQMYYRVALVIRLACADEGSDDTEDGTDESDNESAIGYL
ncbi:aflatoxin b1 aldehyde reductase member 2 [Colletotrichum tabaci]|uniref:Aflatoxin b1 aldehyde reductase member 2 n=1 Tax=Colletotrichum tabaci TaxID=1209068 RepID=A0AAV9T755_9PEZI